MSKIRSNNFRKNGEYSLHISGGSIALANRYYGETDTAVLMIVDKDYELDHYVTVFLDGQQQSRLAEAIEAFNKVMSRPVEEDPEHEMFVREHEAFRLAAYSSPEREINF